MTSRPATSRRRRSSLRDALSRERFTLLFAFVSTCAIAATCLPASTSFSKQNQKLIIYPQNTSSIHFAHALHQEASCESCHQGITTSTRAGDRHAPTMDACTSCHTTSATKAPLQQCSSCHTRFDASPISKADLEANPEAWRTASPAPMRAPSAQAALHFSHAAHQETPCIDCHAIDASRDMPSSPTMQQCVTCHTSNKAPTTCETCHLSRDLDTIAPAPSRVEAPSKLLVREAARDGEPIPPSSHTKDWLARHGIIALTERDDCLSCHTEQSCGSCHNTQSGKPLAHHPQNYLITHRLSARQDTQDCTSCHRQEASCLECHKDLMASPQTFPAQLDGFHPKGWLDASSSQSHGVMARRNINECASCHTEQDCVSCHQGISPHPPEWRTQCKQWLDQNALACVKCHTQQALESLCP